MPGHILYALRETIPCIYRHESFAIVFARLIIFAILCRRAYLQRRGYLVAFIYLARLWHMRPLILNAGFYIISARFDASMAIDCRCDSGYSARRFRHERISI